MYLGGEAEVYIMNSNSSITDNCVYSTGACKEKGYNLYF